MSRFAALALAAAAALALAGCKKDEPASSPPPPPPPPAAAPVTPPPPPPPPAPAPAATGGKLMDAAMSGKPLWATIKTTKGEVVVELYSKDAPRTVANFVGLAAGEKPWTDVRTGAQQSRPLYNDTIFHRVIPGFMIQGGDPLGNGTGDPGYKFEDEFQGGKVFDHPGILAMANAGPNTNGSQFFITVAPTPHLTNRHTIFGNVIRGYNVVEQIARVPRDARDRPLEPVRILGIAVTDQNPQQAQ
ncbi:MAG TPA: peptidylprolyl isomerase [Myxococcales bacterium]|nr:peptidylprolyl isomerase [Myxococcales bacterium]